MALPARTRVPCDPSRPWQAEAAPLRGPRRPPFAPLSAGRIPCGYGRHPRLLACYVGTRGHRRLRAGALPEAEWPFSGNEVTSAAERSDFHSYDRDDDDAPSDDYSQLSEAVAEAASARLDLAISVQREKELTAAVAALQSEASSLRQAADQAFVLASTQLEARESAAKKLLAKEAEGDLKRAAAKAATRIRQLEDELTATTLRAERELREAVARVKADAATSLVSAVKQSKAVATAAEARSAALQNQLVGSEELASRLTATLRAKASADNDVASLVTAAAALSSEMETLRAARAAAEMRATDGEARTAAAERSVSERVRDILAAAESCVAAAETVKAETEQRAAAAALCAAQELQAAQTRAEVAEAELGRRELLLIEYAEYAAAVASQKIELVGAAQRISALEAECGALREARAAAEEASTSAQARTLAAEAAVASDVKRLVAANDQKWRAADSMVKARAVQLPLELKLARADAAGAVATAKAATDALKVLEASVERQRASMLRALQSAELSLSEWKARALALEAGAAQEASNDARAPGRLRATLGGVELRRLLAQGPRGESDPVRDLYAELEETPTPEPVE